MVTTQPYEIIYANEDEKLEFVTKDGIATGMHMLTPSCVLLLSIIYSSQSVFIGVMSCHVMVMSSNISQW
jgi:hypothetical protein